MEIKYDEWVEKYKPIPHPDSKDGHIYYETFGHDYEMVKNANPNNVWTLVQADEDLIIINHFAWVNRINYLITEVPYNPDEQIEVID